MAKILLALYQFLFVIGGPLLKILLQKRVKKGKEIAARLQERYGYATLERPQGKIIWFHGASVGETLSLLPLFKEFREKNIPFLVTTGTVSAAQILMQKLPQVLHQFFPLDHPWWTQRFLNFWQPAAVVWAESEFWPTILHKIKQQKIPLILLNGGISERSLQKWGCLKPLLRSTLESFTYAYSRSSEQTKRLKKAGLASLKILEGNIKFLSAPLKIDQTQQCTLHQLKQNICNRPVWVAASTHGSLSSGNLSEEMKVLSIHKQLRLILPHLLTIIVPRHPHRRDQILKEMADQPGIACRSLQQPLTDQVEIYIADTLGELGIFFQLTRIAFIGGSLVPIGGHNLLEPIQLGAVPLSGPYTHTNKEMVDMLKVPWIVAGSEEELLHKVKKLLIDKEFCEDLNKKLMKTVQEQQKQLIHIFDSLKEELYKIIHTEKS